MLDRVLSRGGSRADATSKMERFVIIVNGFQSLTVITKGSILDVATVLDPPLREYASDAYIQRWLKIFETVGHQE